MSTKSVKYSKQYTIGVDFGSLSARAVLMRVSDGEVVSTRVFEYPHGVLYDTLPAGTPLPPNWALQVPADYRNALHILIPRLMADTGVKPEQIIGLGLDVTSTTMMPTTIDGVPLCELINFVSEPHAYIKMWKHHAAQRQADRILALAKAENVPWLKQFGSFISGEHYLPKVAQIADEAPMLYEKCGRLVEVGDWLVWQLTGKESRNYCSAAYKMYYSKTEGDVSPGFLEKVNPLLKNLRSKLPPRVVMPGDVAGVISAEASEFTGLLAGTPVSAAGVDAHVTSIGSKVTSEGDVLLIIGPSTCIMMLSDEYREVDGINGVVPDGIMPGMNAYEGGQAAVGDIFAWFCENCVPQAYYEEAKQKNISIQQLLTAKASGKKPGETGLIALDWINGVRSTLMDFDLSGLICGVTLETKPEDIYRALVEATAFGAWKIVSQLIKEGVAIDKVYASGGIPLKNPMLMQIYADVFNRDIFIIDDQYSAAVGSAILGFAASEKGGGFKNLGSIVEKYRHEPETVYHPIRENAAVYEKLFEIYSELYEEYGRRTDIMKRLRKIRGDTQ